MLTRQTLLGANAPNLNKFLMIDVFCWNIRGFNKSVRQRSFRKWFRRNNTLFGSLIETRVKVFRSQKFIQSTFPGWNAVANYENADLGRIWVVWDPSVVVTVLHKSAQMVSCVVKSPQLEEEIVVSFVYALNCRNGRRELWNDMVTLAANPILIDKPWMVLGDFNQALNPEDSSSGSSRISGGMEEFRTCLLSAHLFDLSYRGNHFTWWNKQELNPIAKKLDRVLVNDNWLQRFPLSYGEFLDPEFFDHCSSCAHFGMQIQRKKRPFRFSNFLLDNRKFLPIVSEAWTNFHISGTRMFVVSKKLKMLKGPIRTLHRNNYSGIEKRVADAALALSKRQEDFLAAPSPALAELEKIAHKQWMELAVAEEKFFQQRSRVQWSGKSDSNTAFYHRMVASRTSSNQIHYLIANDGRRIERQEDIAAHCVQFSRVYLVGSKNR